MSLSCEDFKLVLTKLVADLIDDMCCTTVMLTNLEQMSSLTDVSANFDKGAACYTLRRAVLKDGMKALFFLVQSTSCVRRSVTSFWY
ncbi:MAG: hypothetical protein ACKESB_00470 [Candidatus Hodgkinia cicadicola]